MASIGTRTMKNVSLVNLIVFIQDKDVYYVQKTHNLMKFREIVFAYNL